MSRIYAHTLPGRSENEWQDLREHLEQVARRSHDHGAAFDASGWASLAGLWHDLGKYSSASQEYWRTASSPDPHIADSATRTDHSTAGAQRGAETLDNLRHLLAYPIASHHGRLLNGRSARASPNRSSPGLMRPRNAPELRAVGCGFRGSLRPHERTDEPPRRDRRLPARAAGYAPFEEPCGALGVPWGGRRTERCGTP